MYEDDIAAKERTCESVDVGGRADDEVGIDD
jgi:hypothetical protein